MHKARFPQKRDYHFDLHSIELMPTNISHYDCLVLATDHDTFDYGTLSKHARLIIDTRGRLQGENVVNA